MPPTMVSIDTAPRDHAALVQVGRAQLFMLALKLKVFGDNKEQESAFLQDTTTEEQANIVLRALQQYDVQAGRVPGAMGQPAPQGQPVAAQPMAQPAAQQQPLPFPPQGAPQQPPPQHPMAGYPTPGPTPQLAGAPVRPAAPVYPGPQTAQPVGMPTPMTANVIGMPGQPAPGQPMMAPPQMAQPMPTPPAAPPTPPQQLPAQPALQPMTSGRQPSTASDPTNAGAVPPTAAAALPAAMTNIVSALKAVQTGLSQCASKSDVSELRNLLIGACNTQNAILVLLMRLSEQHIGLPMDAMARMIDVALKDGEPEKWFEGLGDGLGKE